MAATTSKASMSTAPSPTAIRRLSRDLQKMKEEPVDGIEATPLEENILEWHYVIRGSKGTSYEGGLYHGKLVFPSDFPWKPPSIYMFTPNGRFIPNQRLCLSISDYHPESWNPGWTVSAILVGLHSFMNESSIATGTETTTEERKRELAVKSAPYNLRDTTFCSLFPSIVSEIQQAGVEPMDEEQFKEAKNSANTRYARGGAYNMPLNAADFRQHMQNMHADLEAVMRAAIGRVPGAGAPGPGGPPLAHLDAMYEGQQALLVNVPAGHMMELGGPMDLPPPPAAGGAAAAAVEAAVAAGAAAVGVAAGAAERMADDAAGWQFAAINGNMIGDMFEQYVAAAPPPPPPVNRVMPVVAADDDVQQQQQQQQQLLHAAGAVPAATPPRRAGDAHSDAPAAKRTPPVVTLD